MAKVTRMEKKEERGNRDWGWLKMPEDDRESRILEKGSLVVQEEAGNLVVKDGASLQVAQALLVRIAEIKKGIKARKEQLLKPIKQQLVKPMEQFFRMMETPIMEVDAKIRSSIVHYREKVREEEKELEGILKEGGEEGIIPTPMGISHQGSTSELSNGKIVASMVWKHEVVEVGEIPEWVVRAAIETPRGREALDQSIRGLIKGGVREIPGCRIFETENLAVTAME
jgi:hypothetical protein